MLEQSKLEEQWQGMIREAFLLWQQGDIATAVLIEEKALDLARSIYPNDHNNLATSINNLAESYRSQGKIDRAFSLFLEAVEVEDNILRQWFGYSSEENRLGFVQGMQVNLEVLVSCLCQYFPQDREKVAQVAIAVARRKAFAAQAEVELNYLRYSDRYPDLTADFEALATAQSQLTTLNHDYHARGNDPDPQLKQTLIDRIDRLERKLSANVPELRQLQQQITIPAIVNNLPKYSHAIEFYRFNVYDFAAHREDPWRSPQYVAFIWSDLGVKLLQLGETGEIDELISDYRDLAKNSNLPSFGARPNPQDRQSQPTEPEATTAIDLQLSQRLLSPILAALNGQPIDLDRSIAPQLIFVPDGDLHILPIGNLPIAIDSDPRLLQEVGDLITDYCTCTYLSTLRELLPRIDRPTRSPNPAIAIANPNYDYPLSPDPRLLEEVGDLKPTMRSLMSQLGANFTPIPESENCPELIDRVATAVDPLRQHGLALAGANSWLAGEELPADMGKGFLLARDVADLDLWDTELAIAIACSSGMGDVKNGEGIFGLRRAFAIAGVKTLITSLWDVPTRPTMLLTDKFFEAYHRGVTPAIALQTAQQYLRNVTREELAAMELGAEILTQLQGYSIKIPDPNYPLRHPFFWGAWICQGYTR